MPDNAHPSKQAHLYLPAKDRSRWVSPSENLPLQYLAWGARNFFEEPIPTSAHSGWVGAVILEGKPTLQTEHTEIQLSPGSIVTIAPSQISGWTSPENTNCRFLLWVWQDSPNIPGFNLDHIWQSKLSSQQRSHFRNLHDLSKKEISSIDEQSAQSLRGHFIILSAALQRVDVSPSKNTRDNERLHKAKQWILKNLDSPQPIARLCDFLDISQSSLHRLFISSLSMSPQKFIHQLKMQTAQQLLDDKTKSVKEVAYELGYRHPGDLRRALNAFHQCRHKAKE